MIKRLHYQADHVVFSVCLFLLQKNFQMPQFLPIMGSLMQTVTWVFLSVQMKFLDQGLSFVSPVLHNICYLRNKEAGLHLCKCLLSLSCTFQILLLYIYFSIDIWGFMSLIPLCIDWRINPCNLFLFHDFVMYLYFRPNVTVLFLVVFPHKLQIIQSDRPT